MWAESGGIPRHAALRRGYKCRCGIARNPEPVTTGAWARDVPRFQDAWELGFGLCAQGRTSSRERVDLLVGEASWHDHDRDRESRGGLAGDRRNERTGTVLARAGGEHEERDVLVLPDELRDRRRPSRRRESPVRVRRLRRCALLPPPLRGAAPPPPGLPRSSPRRRRSTRNCRAASTTASIRRLAAVRLARRAAK